MADELVLNFDLPSAAPATTRARSHKGGRWTDRAKERKRGQIEHRKAQRGDAPALNNTASPHGTKRPRDDDDGTDDRRPNKTKAPRPTGGPAPPGHHRPQQEVGFGGKKQFVSSLFTRDGLPEPAPSTSSAPVAPAKPSNAPLTSAAAAAAADDDDQQQDDAPDPAPELTKLGLSRELVAGLAGKLGITGPTACQAGAIPRLVPSAAHGPHKRKQRDFAHDAILRAQTGSGKTLTFLLPMVQDLLSLPPSLLRSATASSSSSSSGPDRSIGTLALILAPTRELASQIHTVLESLLSSLPSSAPATAAQPFSISPRALTAGLLVGGANRTHEKRRLRKGCPIVVATPGRLLDHLKTTEAFRLAGEAARVKGPQGRPGNPNNAPLGARSAPGGGPGDARVGLRWLVVDECDRLMDLGFEEQMKGILEELERRSAASPKGPAREWGRRTILCSATASEGVDRLAGLALGNGGDGDGAAGGEMPVLGARDDVRVKEPVRKDLTVLGAGAKGGADDDDEGDEAAAAATDGDDGEATALALPTGFTPPSQLLHHFVVVPPKLRFVALVALLRKLLVRQQQSGKGSKILVFMSCTDAVDFWWSALGKMRMGSSSSDEAAALEHDAEEREADSNDDESKRLVSTHPLLPAVPIYRLHGSLPLQTRLASLGAFSGKYKIAEGKRAGQDTDAGVLLCTSVAARGLDVKNVGCVVQVDAPTEGGVTEYVHRVGRTARAGAQGTAYTFLLPTETAYTSFLESGINASAASGGGKLRLREVGVEQVLREGYGGEGREYETRATDVQMGFERWVSASEETASAARRAFQAHVRAYATHPSAEKSIFNTKALHLGHLAKSFGMREAPGHAAPTKGGKKGGANSRSTGGNGGGATKRERDENDGSGGAFETGRRRKAMDAEAKMKKLMRGPKANGGGEFQIAGSDMLEGMVKRK
ncbi:uncharacterized protein RHOBADRAFT_56090 [Rhodotorula graminis WP1]|uniref:ATP-dependent RNA helicase n=1 Tax=Rhodotorula graminis (strain WP1) TaxID=578459 RepID=A0A0P9IS98_RHOGW|nr:uncharacterized protein RHOBADRAFT_56090 [Rhodotorula graminis WP1]KPV72278.1 hypothetical protein RHOBADRAFT_56090 [Rhodotorula graminis WP1]